MRKLRQEFRQIFYSAIESVNVSIGVCSFQLEDCFHLKPHVVSWCPIESSCCALRTTFSLLSRMEFFLQCFNSDVRFLSWSLVTSSGVSPTPWIKMSSAVQATPTGPSTACRNRFWKVSELTESPKRRHVHPYRPSGVGRMVSRLVIVLVLNHSTDTFKLNVINFDKFHPFSCLATKQGVKSSSDTINFTMYFWEVLGFSRGSSQLPSAFIFSLFRISRKMLDGSSWVSPIWFLGMKLTVVPQSTCSLTWLGLTCVLQ